MTSSRRSLSLFLSFSVSASCPLFGILLPRLLQETPLCFPAWFEVGTREGRRARERERVWKCLDERKFRGGVKVKARREEGKNEGMMVMMMMKAADWRRQADRDGQRRERQDAKQNEEGEERQREGWMRERKLWTLASDFYSPKKHLWELPVCVWMHGWSAGCLWRKLLYFSPFSGSHWLAQQVLCAERGMMHSVILSYSIIHAILLALLASSKLVCFLKFSALYMTNMASQKRTSTNIQWDFIGLSVKKWWSQFSSWHRNA